MRLFFLTFLLTLRVAYHAQSAQEVFGTPENDENYPMIRLNNGDFIFAGNTLNPGFGGKDVLVTRTDASGNILWSKQYGGGGAETALSVSPSSDNGILVGGESFSVDPDGDAFMFKLDSSGSLLWWKNYGGSLYDITYSVQGLSDGSIISAGLIESAPVDYDAFLMKTDGNGDTLWTKIIGRPGIDHAVNVIPTSDSGYIFCGKTLSVGQGVCDCWIVKTDGNGDTLWTKVIGGAGWDESMDIIEQPNGYIVCGGSNSEGFSNYDYTLMQLDFQGNLVWVKQYGGVWVEDSYCIQEVPGEGYIFAGYTETYSPTNSRGTDSANAWIVKVNYVGDTLWSMVYGGALKEECFSVAVIPNSGFAFSGYTGSFGDSLQAYLFITDSAGYTGCNERRTQPTVFSPTFVDANYSFNVSGGLSVNSASMQEMNTGTQRTLNCGSPLDVAETCAPRTQFANPVSDDFSFTADRSISEIFIFAINGNLVSQQSAGNAQSVTIIAPEAAGLYILKVGFADGKVENYKVVVAKQ